MKIKTNNVLVVVDKQDEKFLDTSVPSENWNIVWKIIDYRQLQSRIEEIRNLVIEKNIDFLLYSQNDQVGKRISIGPIHKKLKMGYSSFSGIDDKERVIQMHTVFKDFIECGKKLSLHEEEINEPIMGNGEGTFSLIFDTEQLGGVRYGLPRILDLLKRHNVGATFFVTNLVKKVYTNVLQVIQEHGHEVGLHGLSHEYLSVLSLEEQKIQLNVMAEDFDTEINGVNFMGRIDENSISAFINNKIRYFVYPLINYYRLISYPKLSTMPSLISSPNGDIWAFPISVETYWRPWFSIKNMVDSSILQSAKCGFKHISILCHPFRDGNSSHIQTTHRLVRYFIKKGLKPITLSQLLNTLENMHTFSTERISIGRLLNSEKARISSPCTKWDCFAFIPETSFSILRRIYRRSLF